MIQKLVLRRPVFFHEGLDEAVSSVQLLVIVEIEESGDLFEILSRCVVLLSICQIVSKLLNSDRIRRWILFFQTCLLLKYHPITLKHIEVFL